MLVAFSSPVKFSKSVFSGVKFRAKFEVVLQKQFLSVVANHSKSDFSTVDSKESRQVYSTEIPSNTAVIKEVIDCNWLIFYLKLYRVTHRITLHYSAELQTAKQTLTTSKNSTEFTYSDFPCHLKVNRDKLVSISCLWKSKTGERLTITTNLFTKINQLDGFRPLWRSGWEISARSRNQSDCRICWIPLAHELKKG